jgi:hypothetical protein
MKNPGCGNNRGSPPDISWHSSYQIPLSSNAPSAMIAKAKTAFGDDDDALSHTGLCLDFYVFKWVPTVRHPFCGGAAAQHDDRRLARRICQNLVGAEKRRDRPNIDDAPVHLSLHDSAHNLGGVPRSFKVHIKDVVEIAIIQVK